MRTFGAPCFLTRRCFPLSTAHLIAVAANTTKVQECLGRGNVWVVHLDWLYFCRWALARAEEKTFMLVAQVPGQPLPNPVIDKDAPLPQPRPEAPAARASAADGGATLKRRREEAFSGAQATDDGDVDGDDDVEEEGEEDDDDDEDDFDFDAAILQR